MYRSLLVPLDGSPFAEEALPLAMSIARRAGASLHLVAVAAGAGFSFLSEKDSECLAKGWQVYLDGVVERVRSHVTVPVSAVLLEGGDVAPQISAHAESIGADLIVVSTHGRGALGRFWLGSVPHELMSRLSQPLLLVRPGDSPVEWGHESVLRHVLVPLDGSALAEQMIEPAVAFGSLMDADYTLLRVISDIPLGTPEFDSISLSSSAVEVLDEIRSVRKRVQKEARDYLDGVTERLRVRGLRVKTRVTVANDPGTAILKEVEAPGIDLIALETHDRRGLSNLVVGSVARKIVHGALKPILVHSAASAKQSSR